MVPAGTASPGPRDGESVRTFTFAAGARPLRLEDPTVRLRYETYWADRARLDDSPGEAFVRDLVLGEFDDDQELAGATQVEVWNPGRRRGSGSVRHRRPVGGKFVQSDAEDRANAYFQAGPPGRA